MRSAASRRSRSTRLDMGGADGGCDATDLVCRRGRPRRSAARSSRCWPTTRSAPRREMAGPGLNPAYRRGLRGDRTPTRTSCWPSPSCGGARGRHAADQLPARASRIWAPGAARSRRVRIAQRPARPRLGRGHAALGGRAVPRPRLRARATDHQRRPHRRAAVLRADRLRAQPCRLQLTLNILLSFHAHPRTSSRPDRRIAVRATSSCTGAIDLTLRPAPINPSWVIEGTPIARNPELLRSLDGYGLHRAVGLHARPVRMDLRHRRDDPYPRRLGPARGRRRRPAAAAPGTSSSFRPAPASAGPSRPTSASSHSSTAACRTRRDNRRRSCAASKRRCARADLDRLGLSAGAGQRRN